MKRPLLRFLLGSTACAALALGNAQGDGSPRTRIEHGTDVDVAKISLVATVISVEDLIALRDKVGAGMDFAKFHDRRFTPFENTVFRITGNLQSIKIDKEGDINFVVVGKTGVIEIPDLEESKGSPLFKKLRAVHDALDRRYHPTTTGTNPNEKITVEGIGFLGSRLKQGSKPFGETVRLMPAIRVVFSDKQ